MGSVTIDGLTGYHGGRFIGYGFHSMYMSGGFSCSGKDKTDVRIQYDKEKSSD
jgi:hypothetical protein